MALNWSLEKVENCDAVCFVLDSNGKRASMKHETYTLIMMMMVLGFRAITARNWRQVYTRLATIEELDGALFSTADKGDWFYPPELVRDHIGLEVNVADETQAKWENRIGKATVARAISRAQAKLRAYEVEARAMSRV